MPEWCARDPRMTAEAAVLCAALDSMADAAGIVRGGWDELAAVMRLHHVGEHEERIEQPLSLLTDLGIVSRLRGGGWHLRRVAVCAELEPEPWTDGGIAAWYQTLHDEEQATVRATLAEVIRRLGGEP